MPELNCSKVVPLCQPAGAEVESFSAAASACGYGAPAADPSAGGAQLRVAAFEPLDQAALRPGFALHCNVAFRHARSIAQGPQHVQTAEQHVLAGLQNAQELQINMPFGPATYKALQIAYQLWTKGFSPKIKNWLQYFDKTLQWPKTWLKTKSGSSRSTCCRIDGRREAGGFQHLGGTACMCNDFTA